MMNVGEALKRYNKTALNIGVLILALIIAFKIYNSQNAELAVLSENNATESKKNEELKKIEIINKEIEAYAKFINSKENANVFNILGDIAKLASVNIVSIKPGSEEKKDSFVRQTYDLRISSDAYHNIGNFIARLESDPGIFIVESLVINQIKTGGAEKLSVDMRVATVLFKN